MFLEYLFVDSNGLLFEDMFRFQPCRDLRTSGYDNDDIGGLMWKLDEDMRFSQQAPFVPGALAKQLRESTEYLEDEVPPLFAHWCQPPSNTFPENFSGQGVTTDRRGNFNGAIQLTNSMETLLYLQFSDDADDDIVTYPDWYAEGSAMCLDIQAQGFHALNAATLGL